MSLGARIRSLRMEKGMKQSELGKILNVSNVSISGYENETRSPDPEALAKMADTFDVSVDYLLGIPPKEEKDLKEFLRTQASMTYGGKEISDHDLDLLTRLVRTLLEDESK